MSPLDKVLAARRPVTCTDPLDQSLHAPIERIAGRNLEQLEF
jgi:hypothetical protein